MPSINLECPPTRIRLTERTASPSSLGQDEEGRVINPDQKTPVALDSRRIPLLRWRRVTRTGETEVLVGPSIAWLLLAIVALCAKGFNVVSLLQVLWKNLP